MTATPGFDSLAEFTAWCFERRSELLSNRPDLPAPGIPYSKRNLTLGDFDLLLLRWPPDSRCLPHDHGMSEGMVYSIEGSITEHRLYPHKQIFHILEGTSLDTCTACIHYMETKTGCTTVHWYAKEVSEYVIFDPSAQKQWSVSNGTIAATPHSDDIIKELPWQPPW